MHKNLTSSQLLAEMYLKEIGFLTISTNDTVLTMEKDFIVSTKANKIIVTIGINFPIEYPKFYTNDNKMFLMYPHIEQKSLDMDAHGICLFDENDKLYYEYPDYLLQDNLNRLDGFLKKIENNEFTQAEIFEEFDSYWNSTGFALHFNKNYLQGYNDIKLIDLYISKNKSNIYLIDEKEKVNTYFNATNMLYDKKKIIYINFHEKFPSKIPVNYKEFLDAIQYAGYSKQFKNFKKHNNLHSSILFSFNLPSGNLHFASLYIKPTQIKINKKVEIINPIADMINMLKYNTPLLGGLAKDTSSNRVYTRGGNSMNEVVNNKAKKIAIVGCGSIGASLAFKLLKTGCTNLLLIDPERLSVDNIARHILGMEYVNLYKAEALENFLEKQFIETSIESIPKNIIDCFEELKSCDLIISALGSEAKAVETKMIKDAISNDLPPLISCWLEANAVAGHSILFNSNQPTFSKEVPFDIDTFFNSLTILKDDYAKSLYKDDVGCNSSYMPYSFLSADIHINHFAHMVVKSILEEDTQAIFSSIGDLSNLEQYIKDEYRHLNSFSLLTKDI